MSDWYGTHSTAPSCLVEAARPMLAGNPALRMAVRSFATQPAIPSPIFMRDSG